jgi:YD repeat-containing protein
MSQERVSWVQLEVAAPVPFGPGCPPGSATKIGPLGPDLGPPFVCPTGKCMLPVPQTSNAPSTPLLFPWTQSCVNPLNSATPRGTTPQFGNPILAQVIGMLARWQTEVQPKIPGLAAGPGTVNPGGGNLTVSLAPPNEGPAVPAIGLVYNSLSPQPGNAGVGWSISPKQIITSFTKTSGVPAAVEVDRGDGTVLHYDSPDSSGRYRTPGGSTDALQFDNTSRTWTQTAADGSAVHFDPSGRADSLRSPTGGRFTLGYDGGGRLTGVRNWFGDRTTLAYDSTTNTLRRIQQPSGRLTTVVMDGAGHLVGTVQPDGTRVSLAYDANSRLTRHVDPRGQITSYQYGTTDGRLSSFTTPTGAQTAFAYPSALSGYQTQVTDPTGAVTALVFNTAGNLSGLTDPTGARSSYLWDSHRLVGHVNARGYRSSFTYAAKSDRTSGLASMRDARGGVYTFLYDTNGRVTGLVDQLANRATLTWSGSGVRTGVSDPVGGQTAYAYNADGQVSSVTDPLGRRSSVVHDSRGSIAAQVDPLGNRSSITYNTARQVNATIDPLGRRATLTRVSVAVSNRAIFAF